MCNKMTFSALKVTFRIVKTTFSRLKVTFSGNRETNTKSLFISRKTNLRFQEKQSIRFHEPLARMYLYYY